EFVRLPSTSNKRKGSPCASEKRPSQLDSKETSTINADTCANAWLRSQRRTRNARGRGKSNSSGMHV
ncbi:unnamed protein product, partial [Ascophyllum nodosum]